MQYRTLGRTGLTVSEIGVGGLAEFQRLRDEGKVRYLGFTTEGPSAGVEELIATGAFDTMQVRYNLMVLHPSDWHNDTGVIRQAEEQGIGIILMRPLTSGVFQRLMADAFPQIDTLQLGQLLLNYVLSDPYVDVALVGGHGTCLGEPRFVEPNNTISADVASRIDGCEAHLGGAARSVCPLRRKDGFALRTPESASEIALDA